LTKQQKQRAGEKEREREGGEGVEPVHRFQPPWTFPSSPRRAHIQGTEKDKNTDTFHFKAPLVFKGGTLVKQNPKKRSWKRKKRGTKKKINNPLTKNVLEAKENQTTLF